MSEDPLDILLGRLRGGDKAVLEQLSQQYGPYLRVVVRRYLSPVMRGQLDSADLVQSVWLHLLRRLRPGCWDFNQPREFQTFLVKTMRHRVIDHARRIQSDRRREEQAGVEQEERERRQPRPSENVRAGELWERMLACCPPKHRPILEYKQQGLSNEEISVKTGMHPGSVRRVLHDLAVALSLREV